MSVSKLSPRAIQHELAQDCKSACKKSNTVNNKVMTVFFQHKQLRDIMQLS